MAAEADERNHHAGNVGFWRILHLQMSHSCCEIHPECGIQYNNLTTRFFCLSIFIQAAVDPVHGAGFFIIQFELKGFSN